MFKSIKLLAVSLVVVAVASSALATTSRVIGLGSTGNYINDDSDVFRWYGTLPSYTNMVMVEAGQASGGADVSADYQALGFTHNWGEDHWLGTWAIFLLYNSIEDMSFYGSDPTGFFSGNFGTPGFAAGIGGLETPTTKFALAWGKELERVALGVNFTRSDASTEVTGVGGTKFSINYMTIGAGARLDMGDDMYGDVAVTFGIAGGDSSSPASSTSDLFDKGSSFDIAARAFYEWRDDVTVVPFFGWSSYEYALAAAPTGTTHGEKGSMVQFGASLNMDVNTSNLLIFATELNFQSYEPSATASGDQTKFENRAIPEFTIALESDINSWLTTRVGASKQMWRVVDTDTNGDETTDTGPFSPGGDFEWSLGAGFHLGEWDVDAVFSHEIPFRLGYWITGYGSFDSDPPIGRVSATYRF